MIASSESSGAIVTVAGMTKAGGTRMRLVPLALIAVGVLFLLANLGVLPAAAVHEMFATWWPLIPLGLGIAALAGRHRGCRMRHVRKADESV